MTVLIAGCGDLGTEVGLRFAHAGHRVVGLRRSPGKLPPEIEGWAVDLTRPLPDLPGDLDVVVVATAADERSEQAYRAAYVDGLRHLLDALDRQGSQPRLLLVSSTAVYGVGDGSWVDEATPAEPASSTGAILLEAERLLRARAPRAIILRAAGIYGPGRTYVIDALLGGTATIPDPPVSSNRMHRDDVAAAIVHLTTEVEEPDAVYIGVDDAPVERGEVLRFLADELGVDHPPTAPHQPGMRGAGDKRLRNDRLKATGFSCAYPTYREGYRAVLAGEGRRHS